MSLTVLTFGFMGLGALLIANERSNELTAEEAITTNALRSVAERMRSTPFEDVANTYRDFVFTVDGLDQGLGLVTVLEDETDSSADAVALGLPRDLDGDGVASNVSVSASYMLLPVKIEVAWVGRDGSQTRTLYLLLASED